MPEYLATVYRKPACNKCGKCEKHWRGVGKRFNCAGFFEMTTTEFKEVQGKFEWVRAMCPENAIDVTWEVVRDE